MNPIGDVFKKAKWHLIGWLSTCNEFVGPSLQGFYLSWEGCMRRVSKDRKPIVGWVKPPLGSFKFNVDRAAFGKPGPAGIGGVLHDNRGRMVLDFSEFVAIMESNEAELRPIRRALGIWSTLGNGPLWVEGDSTNVISWASKWKTPPVETD